MHRGRFDCARRQENRDRSLHEDLIRLGDAMYRAGSSTGNPKFAGGHYQELTASVSGVAHPDLKPRTGKFSSRLIM